MTDNHSLKWHLIDRKSLVSCDLPNKHKGNKNQIFEKNSKRSNLRGNLGPTVVFPSFLSLSKEQQKHKHHIDF